VEILRSERIVKFLDRGGRALGSLTLLVVLMVGSALASGSEPGELKGVKDIRITGNQRVDSAALRTQLTSNPGAVTPESVSADIKALYRTGFFDQVSAAVSTDDAGVRVLQYSVVEKPVVRKVFIKGNKEVDEKNLTDIIKFGTNRFLDRNRVQALMRDAVSYYQSKGFYEASFDYSVVPISDNQVDLTFTVTEGPEFKIEKVRFTGLKEIDADDLRDAMQTKRYKWYSSWLLGTGRLNRDMLEGDRGLIRQWFLDHGWLDGTVSEPGIDIEAGSIVITFDIEEGQQYRVGAISASGDLLNGSEGDTIADIKTASGEIFSATAIREDSFTISDKFSDIGYAFANVVPGTNVDRGGGTVDLDFAVSKGNLVEVNRIKIRGNEKTYDHVIRRELKIEEQAQYSGAKVRRSRQLLQRLGYFEEVNISTEPTGQPDTVDLNVNVREGATGQFSAGVGFSSSDGGLFNARLSENNLFGTGRSASINLDLGTERNNLILSLNDRRFNDTYLALGANVLRSEREFSDFDRTLAGGGIEAGYPLEEVFGAWSEDVSASLQYEYLDIEISNVDEEDAADLVIESEGTSTSSAITPKLVRNTINNPLNPTDGSRQVLSFEYSGLGGSEEYYLFEVRQQLYYPLWASSFGEFTFAWRTAFGYGETFDDDPFPLFKRYFPGGINSVRGFENRSLGPKDDRGNEYGGSKELINNLEIIFPLVQSAGLRGVIFYDVGEAFDDNEAIQINDLRQAYGAGIRWSSPLGPIRVEFGFPLDREEGEDSMVTLFSFGAPL